MYEQRLEEESFVENIYHQSIAEQNTQVDAIKALIKPVDRLSGDILLTCYTPNMTCTFYWVIFPGMVIPLR